MEEKDTKKTQAVILMGGTGSRLGNLVENIPKPCLPVCGRPFIFHLLQQLATAGISEVLLLTGYRADVVRNLFGEEPSFAGISKVTIVTEDVPKGTGGAILNAAQLLDETFLLLNGDSYFHFDLRGFLVDGRRQPAGCCYLALSRIGDGSRYGQVELSDGIVLNFSEKKAGANNILINAGLYWCHKSVLDHLPRGHSSLELDLFPTLVAMKKLRGAEYPGDFIDIGIPEDYFRAEVFLQNLKTGPSF